MSLLFSAQILQSWKVLPISQYSSYCSWVTYTTSNMFMALHLFGQQNKIRMLVIMSAAKKNEDDNTAHCMGFMNPLPPPPNLKFFNCLILMFTPRPCILS